MGKHIEDIHAFPLPLLHPRRQAGVKLLSCLASLGGGLVTPAKSTGRRPKRGVRGGLGAKWEVFPPWAVLCGCEHVLVLLLEQNTLLAQAGEIPLAEPEMTLGGFIGSELFSLLLGRTERPGLITFILRDDPA